MRIFIGLSLLLLLGAAGVDAATGVRGRIAWRGELVPGVTVRAYERIEDIDRKEALAVSEPSGVDGTYSLALPPGSYYLTASDAAGKPAPGDYFCYYSGSPVRVQPDHQTTVGFNLIRIPHEPTGTASPASGIRGELTFQDEPLKQAYLYVYEDPSRGFKGPGYFVQPVADGTFRLRLPPGEYYLLARKRARGGQFGPIEIGDYFNYYHGNPVRVEPNRMTEVRLETITRMPLLEEGEALPFRGVRGVVLTDSAAPAAGLHVFAYRQAGMTGTPDFFSAATGPDGSFELALPGAGPYYLLAREHFGGPATEGERYGKYNGRAGHAVILDSAASVEEIEIHVEAQTAR